MPRTPPDAVGAGEREQLLSPPPPPEVGALAAPPFVVACLDVPAALLAAAHAHIARGSSPRVAKPGGRSELALPLDTPGLSDLLRALGRPRAELVFASLLVAHTGRGDAHQAFHCDGDGADASAGRALIYLSDVAGPDDGAVEFAGAAPVVGPRGTAVSFAASTLHRGRANAVGLADRLALGLAFSSSGMGVCTIGHGGGGCGGGGCGGGGGDDGGGGDGGGSGGGGVGACGSGSSSSDYSDNRGGRRRRRHASTHSRSFAILESPQDQVDAIRLLTSIFTFITLALTIASILSCWTSSYNTTYTSGCIGLIGSAQSGQAAATAAFLALAAIGAAVVFLGPCVCGAEGAGAALTITVLEFWNVRLVAAAAMLVFLVLGLALGLSILVSVPVVPHTSRTFDVGANSAIAAVVFAVLVSVLLRFEWLAAEKVTRSAELARLSAAAAAASTEAQAQIAVAERLQKALAESLRPRLMKLIIPAGLLGIDCSAAESAAERRALDCRALIRAVDKGGSVDAQLEERGLALPCGIVAVNGKEVRYTGLDKVLKALAAAAQSGEETELELAFAVAAPLGVSPLGTQARLVAVTTTPGPLSLKYRASSAEERIALHCSFIVSSVVEGGPISAELMRLGRHPPCGIAEVNGVDVRDFDAAQMRASLRSATETGLATALVLRFPKAEIGDAVVEITSPLAEAVAARADGEVAEPKAVSERAASSASWRLAAASGSSGSPE